MCGSRMSTFLIERYIKHETISLYWDSTDMYLRMATATVIKTLSYFDYVHKAWTCVDKMFDT